MADMSELVEQLFQRIIAALKDQPAPAQGAALAKATAVWLAGHHPRIRPGIVEAHLEQVRGLTDWAASELQPYINWDRKAN